MQNTIQTAADQNPTTLPVRFIKQGGLGSDGTAVGRKGQALLIQYVITDGSRRERWIPGKRVLELHGDIDSLPRWKSASCPAVKFDEPRALSYGDRLEAYVVCSKCGEQHRPAVTYTHTTASLDSWTGYKSNKLADVLVQPEPAPAVEPAAEQPAPLVCPGEVFETPLLLTTNERREWVEPDQLEGLPFEVLAACDALGITTRAGLALGILEGRFAGWVSEDSITFRHVREWFINVDRAPMTAASIKADLVAIAAAHGADNYAASLDVKIDPTDPTRVLIHEPATRPLSETVPGHRVAYTVIACGATKRTGRHAAQDLYCSPNFRLTLEAAKLRGVRVLILSAKHGLVAAEQEIDCYDQRLNEPGAITGEQVAGQIADLKGARVFGCFLPKAYAEVFERAVFITNTISTNHFAGTRGIGEQRGVCAEIIRQANA
jgi:hypothetical protein